MQSLRKQMEEVRRQMLLRKTENSIIKGESAKCYNFGEEGKFNIVRNACKMSLGDLIRLGIKSTKGLGHRSSKIILPLPDDLQVEFPKYVPRKFRTNRKKSFRIKRTICGNGRIVFEEKIPA